MHLLATRVRVRLETVRKREGSVRASVEDDKRWSFERRGSGVVGDSGQRRAVAREEGRQRGGDRGGGEQGSGEGSAGREMRGDGAGAMPLKLSASPLPPSTPRPSLLAPSSLSLHPMPPHLARAAKVTKVGVVDALYVCKKEAGEA